MPGKVSWKWGGKTYSGTLIRETKTHKYARTENGKVKTIKKQMADKSKMKCNQVVKSDRACKKLWAGPGGSTKSPPKK